MTLALVAALGGVARAPAATTEEVRSAVWEQVPSLFGRLDDHESTASSETRDQIAAKLAELLELFPQIRNAPPESVTPQMVDDGLRASVVAAFTTPFYPVEEARNLLNEALVAPLLGEGAGAGNWMAALLPYAEQAGLCSGDPLSATGRTCAFSRVADAGSGPGFEGSYVESQSGPMIPFPLVQRNSNLESVLDFNGTVSLARSSGAGDSRVAGARGLRMMRVALSDVATHASAFTTFLAKYRFDGFNVDIWGEAHHAERVLLSTGEADVILGVLPFGFEVKIFDRDVFDLIRLAIQYFVTGSANIGGTRWPNWPRRDWGVRIDGDIKSNFNRALECGHVPIPGETSPVYIGMQYFGEGRDAMFPGLQTHNLAPRQGGNEYAVEIYPRPNQVGLNTYGIGDPVAAGSPVLISAVRWFYFEWLLKAAWYQDFFLVTATSTNGGHGCHHDWRKHKSLVGKRISPDSPRYDADLFWSWDARGSYNPHGLPTTYWWASFWAR